MRVVAAQAGAERAKVDGIPSYTAPYPWLGIAGKQDAKAARNLTDAEGPQYVLLAFEADRPGHRPRHQAFSQAQADAEPAKALRHGMRRSAPRILV
jgi:hypothetical protein